MLALRVHKRKVMMVNVDKWLFDFELISVSCFAGFSSHNIGLRRGQGLQDRNSHLYVLASKEDGTGGRIFSVDNPLPEGATFVGDWINIGIGWVSESAARTEYDLWGAGRQEHIGSGNIRLESSVCRRLANHGTSLASIGGPVDPTPNERTVTVLLKDLNRRLTKAQKAANLLTRALVKVEERRFPMFQFVGNERGMVSAIAFLQGYRNLSQDITQDYAPGRVGFVNLMSETIDRSSNDLFLQPIFEFIADFGEDATIHGLGSPDWVAALAIHGPWFNPQDDNGVHALSPLLIREVDGYYKGGHYINPRQYTLPDTVPQDIRQDIRKTLLALQARQKRLERLSYLHRTYISNAVYGGIGGANVMGYQQHLIELAKPEYILYDSISTLIRCLNHTRDILTQTPGES